MPTFPLNGAVNLPAQSFSFPFLLSGLATAMTGDDAGRYDRVQATIASLVGAATPGALVYLSGAQSKPEGDSGNVIFTYTVTRTMTAGPLTVPWSFAPGETLASDFTGNVFPAGGGVTFADGVATGTFSISVAGDVLVEVNEVFTVSISVPSGVSAGGPLSATGTILNDDTAAPAPSFSLSSAIVKVEGNSGTAAFVWTLTLFRDGSTAAIPFNWAVTGNGANPADAADFGGTLPSGSGTFASGETTKQITVLVAGDTAIEPSETFLLTVNATGLASVTSTGTISNDDAAFPTVTLTAADVTQQEGNTGAFAYVYTVNRSSAIGAVSVPWTFSPGTTDATDYSGSSFPAGGNVTMADGVSSGTFSVTVNGDATVEPDEVFTVSIVAPTNYSAGGIMSATGNILNDDTVTDDGTTVDYMTPNIASEATYHAYTAPMFVHVPAKNKVFFVTQGYTAAANARVEQVQAYNLATKTVSAPVTAFVDFLQRDGHGVPAEAYWASGDRLFVFGGGHKNPLKVGVSPVGVPDNGVYTELSQIVPTITNSTGLCYNKPFIAGNTLHLFARVEQTSDTKMPFWYGRFTIAQDAGGVVTLTKIDERVLVDTETDSRVYSIDGLLISINGEEIVVRFAAVISDYNETQRRGIFTFQFDSAAKTITNFITGASRSTATPMPKATALSNYRIVQQAEAGLYATCFAHCIDSSGRYHLVYQNDAEAIGNVRADIDVYHLYVDGTTVSTPTQIIGANQKQRYDGIAIAPWGTGIACCPILDSPSYPRLRAGDAARFLWTLGGGWSFDKTIIAANGFASMDRPVLIPIPGQFPLFFCAEGITPPSQGTGTSGSENITLGNARTFLFERTGPIKFPWTAHDLSKAAAARLQTPLSFSDMRSLDALILGWVLSGRINEMDWAWWLTAPSQQMRYMNLLADRFHLQAVGAVAHRQVVGKQATALVGNGGYLVAPDLVPATTTGLKMTSTSVSISAWILENTQQAANDVGTLDGSQSGLFINLRTASDTFLARASNAAGGNMSAASTQSIGFAAARRTGAASTGTYRDYAIPSPSTGSQNNALLPNKAMTLFGNETGAGTRAIGIVTGGMAFPSLNNEGPMTLAAPGQRALVEGNALLA
jgi:hypothetical protein